MYLLEVGVEECTTGPVHGLSGPDRRPARGQDGAVTLSRPDVLRLLEENGISPSRALGQNFVADPNTVRRIARLAGVGPGDRVVEIGAGLGSLTLALLETGASVTAVERDRWLVPALRKVLEERAPSFPVQVVEADAMHLDWAGLLVPARGWVLVANLPYNVATPLVADLLDYVPAVERMLVMVQDEVARRLVASVGDPSYGAVSVKVAYWAEAALVGTVPSSVFVPRPKVGSALVSITAPARPWRRPPPRRARGVVRHRQDRVRPTQEDAAAGVGRVERAGGCVCRSWHRRPVKGGGVVGG